MDFLEKITLIIQAFGEFTVYKKTGLDIYVFRNKSIRIEGTSVKDCIDDLFDVYAKLHLENIIKNK